MTKLVEQHNNSIQEKYQRASEFQISIGEEPMSYEQFTIMYTTYLKGLEWINK